MPGYGEFGSGIVERSQKPVNSPARPPMPVPLKATTSRGPPGVVVLTARRELKSKPSIRPRSSPGLTALLLFASSQVSSLSRRPSPATPKTFRGVEKVPLACRWLK